jgi:hypothetical protein
MVADEKLQSQLMEAIRRHADPREVQALLDQGASANDVEVTELLNDAFDVAPPEWSASIAELPAVSHALAVREAADQAAFDLIAGLESNDLDIVQEALHQMAEAGDDANVDMGDGSMLAIAIANRCDVEIIAVLIGFGKTDVSDFSQDALQVLNDAEAGAWNTEIGSILKSKLLPN